MTVLYPNLYYNEVFYKGTVLYKLACMNLNSTVSVTSSGPMVHDKVYINEIMVNKQGVFQKVELSSKFSL